MKQHIATSLTGLIVIAAISASSAAVAVGDATSAAVLRTAQVAHPGDTPWG